jgi:hypothetical protein
VLNPYPAGITDSFLGQIGADIAVPNYISSVVNLAAATF